MLFRAWLILTSIEISMSLDCYIYIDQFTINSYVESLSDLIEKCNRTISGISVINSDIEDIRFTKTIEAIKLIDGRHAIFIKKNKQLEWHNENFVNLKTIGYVPGIGIKQSKNLVSIEENNKFCFPEYLKDKIEDIAKKKGKVLAEYAQFQSCGCEHPYGETLDFNKISQNCEHLHGDLILDETNTNNPTILLQLASVRIVTGKVQVLGTGLANLNFLRNITTINNEVKPNTRHISGDWSNSMISNHALLIYNNNYLTSLGLNESLIISKIWSKYQRYIYIENNKYLTFTKKEQEIFAKHSPLVSIQKRPCVASYQGVLMIHITETNFPFYSNCTRLIASQVVFSHESPPEAVLMNNEWVEIEGCLAICNTSFTSLSFLHRLKRIHCNSTIVSPLLIYNNTKLLSLDFDVSISSLTDESVKIAYNPRLCPTYGTQFVNLLRTTVSSSSITVGSMSPVYNVTFIGFANKEIECEINVQKDSETLLAMMLSMLLAISIIIIGLIYIFPNT